jgi:hypothetical protein
VYDVHLGYTRWTCTAYTLRPPQAGEEQQTMTSEKRFPTVGETLTPVLVLPSVLAEVSLILWLLMKGLNVQRRIHHVPASVEHVPASGRPS